MVHVQSMNPALQTQALDSKHQETRLAEIGALSAKIVHEVRNPLTTILMGLKSLQKLDLGELDHQRLDLALSEAERLQRLLNQILQYSKPKVKNTSRIELNCFFMELFHSQQLIHHTVGKNIQLIPTSMPLPFDADIDKLKQVFINLIKNACDASPGTETVTCNIVQTDSRTVCIKIHNWGPPIPDDLLPQLTQPFFTTKPEGNGLGLAIVQQIIDDHQGRLQINSNHEHGTTVRVTLSMKDL